MKVYVEWMNGNITVEELNVELINRLNNVANYHSDGHSQFIVSSYVDKNNNICFFFNGPWEC